MRAGTMKFQGVYTGENYKLRNELDFVIQANCAKSRKGQVSRPLGRRMLFHIQLKTYPSSSESACDKTNLTNAIRVV